jgi:pimeloyl-ACP methyl ester carboxylesterase
MRVWRYSCLTEYSEHFLASPKKFCNEYLMQRTIVLISFLVCMCVGAYLIFTAEPKPLAKEIVADDYVYIDTRCWFSVPNQSEIRCGELHTPKTDGGFKLPVVRIIDRSPDHQPDSVIYLSGGPGGSARLHDEGIQQWQNWLDYAGLSRDLILMETRGVGHSKPALTCSAYDRFSLSALKFNLSLKQELAQGYDVIKQCFADFSGEQYTLDKYSTRKSAEDLQALMRLLAQKNPEDKRWNLLGVSYGSRLAVVAASDFPLVRSMILDSVYPPGYGGAHEWPTLLNQSLTRYAHWCETTEICASSLAQDQHFIDRLKIALTTLRLQPVTLTVPRWDGEVPIELVLNDHRFLSAVFAALYDSDDWLIIPRAVEAAIARNVNGLSDLVEPFINNAFSEDFNGLVFTAVDCHDHPLSAEADYLKNLKQYPLIADYTRDLWRYQACHFLSKEKALELEPIVAPSQPTLLLAGRLDPITPVEWAQELHTKWPNSQLTIVEDIGHGVIGSEPCIQRNLRAFLDAPTHPFTRCEPH